jgi:hypothetical protein
VLTGDVQYNALKNAKEHGHGANGTFVGENMELKI